MTNAMLDIEIRDAGIRSQATQTPDAMAFIDTRGEDTDQDLTAAVMRPVSPGKQRPFLGLITSDDDPGPADRLASPAVLELARRVMFRDEAQRRPPERLTCHYCAGEFTLDHGGACFEGTAACRFCEQHLNRDLVLPAIDRLAKASPFQVGEANGQHQGTGRLAASA